MKRKNATNKRRSNFSGGDPAAPKKSITEAEFRARSGAGEEDLSLPRINLFEKENWNFDRYSLDDHSKVFEYIYGSRPGHISSIDITKSDIARLKEPNVINDAVLNFYFK